MSDQLSEDEIAALHRIVKLAPEIEKMIESEKRINWLWGSLRVWATWITVVFGAILVAWSAFKDIIKAAAQ